MTRHAEINHTLSTLARYWYTHPELRLGQIIGNATPTEFRNDPYYVPDAFYVEVLKAETETAA